MADTRTETPADDTCSRCGLTFEHLHLFEGRPGQFCRDCAVEMLNTKTEKTVAEELREAAARLRSSEIDLATIEGLPEVVRVGGVPLARCVKCDCVARVDGEAVYQLLIVALLNAREPLASWLEKTSHIVDSFRLPSHPEHEPCDDPCCYTAHHALAVARVLNGGPS